MPIDDKSISLRNLAARLREAPLSGRDWQDCLAAFEAQVELLPADDSLAQHLLYQRANGLLGVWEERFLPPTKGYVGLDAFLDRLRELGPADLWVAVAVTDTMSWAVYLDKELATVEAFVGTEWPNTQRTDG